MGYERFSKGIWLRLCSFFLISVLISWRDSSWLYFVPENKPYLLKLSYSARAGYNKIPETWFNPQRFIFLSLKVWDQGASMDGQPRVGPLPGCKLLSVSSGVGRGREPLQFLRIRDQGSGIWEQSARWSGTWSPKRFWSRCCLGLQSSEICLDPVDPYPQWPRHMAAD